METATFNGVDVHSDGGAVWWEGPLAVDADGSPFAYAEFGGLDALANAGHDGDWWALACDENGKPIIQGSGDPNPGGYVPMTALQDGSKAHGDPARYVDSQKVPFVSIPKDSEKLYGLRPGDVALAYCRQTGRTSAAVVGDVGPKRKYGEGSMKLAENLGLSSSPRRGGASKGVIVVVFRNSRKGWPRPNEDVAQQAQDLLNALGGPAKYGIS